MDRARDHFLAGAGLARDQDGAARGRNRLEQLEQVAHGAALPDNPLETVALLELRAEVRVLGTEPALLERRVERVQELVELERLGDEVDRAALDDIDRVAHRAVARHHDGKDLGIAADRRLNHLRAVDAGQPEVGDEKVERELGEAFEGLLPAFGLDHLEAAVGQPLGHGLAEGSLVFDKQQMRRRIRHLRGVSILTAGPVAVKGK